LCLIIKDFILETKSDGNEIQADDSNVDGESDNETNTSMLTESKVSISQGENFFRIKIYLKFNPCFVKDHLDYYFLMLQLNKNEKMKEV